MLEQVSPEEHILCSSYKELCEGIPGVVYKNTEEAYEYFKQCSIDKHAERVVVVSAHCDFSIRLQAENHPNADLLKMATACPWSDYANDRERYRSVQVGPTVKVGQCHFDDKYSAKVDRYTFYTFNELPKNILRWFVTNLDVEHDRMSWIPFGLNNDGDGYLKLRSRMGTQKTKVCYANFSPNTVERVRLANWCRATPWITYEENVSNDHYLDQVAHHKFTMCPFGNGLDCYRTYEALYLDSIPVMDKSIFSSYLLCSRLPVLITDLAKLSEEYLKRVYSLASTWTGLSNECLTKSFWRTKFENAAKPYAKCEAMVGCIKT
jgi:hypothetical protein